MVQFMSEPVYSVHVLGAPYPPGRVVSIPDPASSLTLAMLLVLALPLPLALSGPMLSPLYSSGRLLTILGSVISQLQYILVEGPKISKAKLSLTWHYYSSKLPFQHFARVSGSFGIGSSYIHENDEVLRVEDVDLGDVQQENIYIVRHRNIIKCGAIILFHIECHTHKNFIHSWWLRAPNKRRPINKLDSLVKNPNETDTTTSKVPPQTFNLAARNNYTSPLQLNAHNTRDIVFEFPLTKILLKNISRTYNMYQYLF